MPSLAPCRPPQQPTAPALSTAPAPPAPRGGLLTMGTASPTLMSVRARENRPTGLHARLPELPPLMLRAPPALMALLLAGVWKGIWRAGGPTASPPPRLRLPRLRSRRLT